MSLRNLRILALLILALSITSYAQSLGDVARQVRAEKQKKRAPHARVITNEDIATSPEPDKARTEDASKEAAKDAAKAATSDAPAAASPVDPAKQVTGAEAGGPKAAESGKKQPQTREEREAETERRTQELNRVYVDRIAAIRKQIETTQSELAKLQQAQLDNTGEFRRTAGLSPYPSEYAAQQQAFNEKIEAKRNLINSLNAQLEDAKEAARHAGVPHATDL